jgi:radical SAM superfamily enzyme YgiQ (UPF0313 family)
MRAAWFIGKFELLLNCTKYPIYSPKSRTPQQPQNVNVVDSKLGLSITATKGCETRCNFCGCSEEEGVTDRTRNPETIFKWYDENSDYLNDTFHLYSPNIISSPDWVKQFHSIYTQRGYSFKWQG